MGQVFEAVAEKVIEKKSRNKDKPQAAKKPAAENLKLGRTVLIIAIIVSLLVIAPVKLSAKRASVMKVFKNGTSKEYTVSVYNDIMECANSASTLAGIAGAADGVTKGDVKELSSLAKDILSEDDEDDLLKMFTELVEIGNDIYSQYEKHNTVSKDAEKAIRNINNARNTVQNDVYWQKAADFNAIRGAFPARLIAGLTGIDKVPDKLR